MTKPRDGWKWKPGSSSSGAAGRIDMPELARHLGPLPSDYQKQSALWYATYRKHANETAVNDANAAYLLYREMTGIVPMLLIAVPVIGCLSQRLRRADRPGLLLDDFRIS